MKYRLFVHSAENSVAIITTSFLCEAVDLLLFSTSSRVEGLHCDAVRYFRFYKVIEAVLLHG